MTKVLLTALLLAPALVVAEGSEIAKIQRANGPGGAAGIPYAIQQQSAEYVVPALIIGGEWTSSIKVLNLSGKTMPLTTLYFVDQNGAPLSATFQESTTLSDGTFLPGKTVTDTAASITLISGAMIEATFFGGSTAQFGHAFFGFCATSSNCSSAGIFAEVLLRNHNDLRPDFESIFPLEQPAASQYMLWDSRGGFSNVIYLVNHNVVADTAQLDMYSSSAQLIQSISVRLPGLGTQFFTLSALASAIQGQQGTMVIHGPNANSLFTVIGLRINPSNSFTPERAFIPGR